MARPNNTPLWALPSDVAVSPLRPLSATRPPDSITITDWRACARVVARNSPTVPAPTTTTSAVTETGTSLPFLASRIIRAQGHYETVRARASVHLQLSRKHATIDPRFELSQSNRSIPSGWRNPAGAPDWQDSIAKLQR